MRNQFLGLAIQLSGFPGLHDYYSTEDTSRVIEQPFKIPFIAAIVIAVNVRKPEVTQEILEKAGSAIQKYLEAGAWREVKLMLRLLGCLQGLLEGDGVFPTLEEFFSRAVDLQTASSEDVSDSLNDVNQANHNLPRL